MLTSSLTTFVVALVVSAVAGYITRSWLVEKHASRQTKLNWFGRMFIVAVIAVVGMLASHVAAMAGMPQASEVFNVLCCVLAYSSLYVLASLANGSLYTK